MAEELKTDFATQAGHWYAPDGSPRYTIVGANGKERPTTVRDARKHGYLPSVTTILRQAAAPGLVKWQKEQVARAAFANPKTASENEQEYLNRIMPISEQIARDARDRGTEIHGAIEKMYLGELWNEHPLYLYAAEANVVVAEWVGNVLDWSAERSFASPLGFGGKLDLSAPGYVLDFKTSDKDLSTLKLWPEHRRQLSAYRAGLGMPDARCAIVYVSSVEPAARVIEIGEEELQQGWEEFKALLAFWKAANKA